MTKVLREIERIVDAEWSDYSIDYSGKSHVRVTLRRGDKSVKLFTAGSPSDQRGLTNFRANVRRAVKSLKEQTNG